MFINIFKYLFFRIFCGGFFSHVLVLCLVLYKTGTSIFCWIQMFFHLCHFDTTQTSNIYPQPQEETTVRRKTKFMENFVPFTSSASLQLSIHLTMVVLRLQRQKRSIFSVELHSALITAAKRGYILSHIWSVWVTDTKKSDFESTSKHMLQQQYPSKCCQNLTMLSEQFHIERWCWFVKGFIFPTSTAVMWLVF